MLHIKNSNNSPSLASTMCTRRHKGMFQTSIILVLFVCIGYGFYLYNLLQVRIKYLDTKALRHQSQQQSLSSQLQAVYEDRAKLEKAVQKSKTELRKTQEEKESVIQEMLIEHQDKNDALGKENDELKKKKKEMDAARHDLKLKLEKVSREHDQLKRNHQNDINEHESLLSDAQANVEEYQKSNLNLQREKEDLEQQVRQSIDEARIALNEKIQALKVVENIKDLLNEKNKRIAEISLQNADHKKSRGSLMKKVEGLKNQYEGIKQALNAIPANAVNFDHPVVSRLSYDSIQLLKDHLGEADNFQPQQVQQVADNSLQGGNNAVPQFQQQQQDHPGEADNFQPQQVGQAQAGNSWQEGNNAVPQLQQQQQGDFGQADLAMGQRENEAKRREYEQRQREYEEQQRNQQVGQQEAGQPGVMNDFENQQQPVAGFPNQDHISPEMQIQNIAPAAQTIDICALTVDPGPCHDPGKIRFAYFPELQQCRGFTYGGCGGNQNNFVSMEDCKEICNDPNRRYVEMSLTEEQQVQEMLDQGVIANDESIQHVVGQPVEEDEEEKYKGLDEQGRLILEQEMNAKREEEEARRELQEQNQNMNGVQDVNAVEDPLKELKENSIKQLEVAKNQQADMQKLLEQQQKDETQPDVVDDVEAKIEDEDKNPRDYDTNEEDEADPNEEEDDDNRELDNRDDSRDDNDKEEEENDSQFDMPPAAKIAGHDPEAVMDAPPADHGIDSKDINGQDIYEQERQEDQDDRDQPLEYRGDNQQDQGAEEDEEDEEDDFNQDDPRDGGFGPDGGEKDDFDDPDQGNEDENNYDNEEEDTEEREARLHRENNQINKDRDFKARREVQDLIPIDIKMKRNREM